ncbi:follistatin-related protein 1-like [Notothenia coriiceps]|uniref:Follistatin-related protein 1-like n=1 Tax=Notothenia coriiceps TaxID=8208 RepID=A0A6I9N6I2_9TELE|nr:PREDICTED: follistatin-related protein 1-like [Notothenia coriiceps]
MVSLRSLCVDALIELSDENADWKLSLTEFINCLTPSYHPYERKEHQVEEDFRGGAEGEELTEEEWSRRVEELNAV